MALRIVGRLKTTVAIGPSCCTRRSALGLTVVQCSRGMQVPALAQAARRSLATSGKMSSDSPDTATVSSRMKRPRAGMAPMTSPPTMKTFAVLAGCRPKISTISSRLIQMPRYLPMRSMAGSFDDAPPAAGGASVLSGCFVLRLLSRRLSRLLATLLGALPRGDRDLLGVAALGALGEANGEDAVVVRRLRLVGVDAVGKRDLAIETDVALDPGVLALVLTLALLVRHGRLLSVIRRWRVRPVDPSTSYRDEYRSPPVSHGPEEVAHRPTDGTSRRSATASRYHSAGARPGPCRARAERRARRAAQALRVVDASRGGGQRVWWRWEELNLRHGAYETPALPLSYTAGWPGRPRSERSVPHDAETQPAWRPNTSAACRRRASSVVSD